MFSTLKDEFATLLSVQEPNQITILEWFLASLDEYFTDQGIIFSKPAQGETEATESKKYFAHDYGHGRSYFYLGAWLQESNAVFIIKNRLDPSINRVLPAEQLLFSKSTTKPNPVFAVQLATDQIGDHEYLEVTGVWKFGEELPHDLKMAALDLASAYLGNYNQNALNQSGQTVSSTSIDKVSFSYKQVKSESNFSNGSFQKALYKYRL